MWWGLLGLIIRHLVGVVTTLLANNPGVVRWLGPGAVAFLQEEQTVLQIVAAVSTVLAIAWSARNKVFDQLEKIRARFTPHTVTIVETKEAIREESGTVPLIKIDVPTLAQIAKAFTAEPTPVEKVIKGN